MHALVRFSHIAAQNTFTTSEIYSDALEAFGVSPEQYSLASLRYDLSELRAKGLVEKVPRSRQYRLLLDSCSPSPLTQSSSSKSAASATGWQPDSDAQRE